MKISLQVWFMEKAAMSRKEKRWKGGQGRGKGPVDAQEWEPNFKFPELKQKPEKVASYL